MRSLFRLFGAAVLAATLSVSAWAASSDFPGVPNFFQVTDFIYRGGQPSDEAWPALAKLGVRTVIDLRRPSEHSLEAEAKAVEAAGMRYVSFPTDGFANPDADQIAKVLEVLTSGEPAFVHCKQGMDRTGTVIAAYRIAHEGWDKERALSEAEACGLHWWSRGMRRFIRDYRPAVLASRAGADSLAAPVATPR